MRRLLAVIQGDDCVLDVRGDAAVDEKESVVREMASVEFDCLGPSLPYSSITAPSEARRHLTVGGHVQTEKQLGVERAGRKGIGRHGAESHLKQAAVNADTLRLGPDRHTTERHGINRKLDGQDASHRRAGRIDEKSLLGHRHRYDGAGAAGRCDDRQCCQDYGKQFILGFLHIATPGGRPPAASMRLLCICLVDGNGTIRR